MAKMQLKFIPRKGERVSGHIVSPLPQVHHDSLLSFKENWRQFWSSIDYFEIAPPHVAFPSSDSAHLPFWMMKVKSKVEKPQYYKQTSRVPRLCPGAWSHILRVIQPDIQIYQLNNSLQYQRGSHARHMHFWSSFEPSRLILKLWNENVRPKKLD